MVFLGAGLGELHHQGHHQLSGSAAPVRRGSGAARTGRGRELGQHHAPAPPGRSAARRGRPARPGQTSCTARLSAPVEPGARPAGSTTWSSVVQMLTHGRARRRLVAAVERPRSRSLSGASCWQAAGHEPGATTAARAGDVGAVLRRAERHHPAGQPRRRPARRPRAGRPRRRPSSRRRRPTGHRRRQRLARGVAERRRPGRRASPVPSPGSRTTSRRGRSPAGRRPAGRRAAAAAAVPGDEQHRAGSVLRHGDHRIRAAGADEQGDGDDDQHGQDGGPRGDEAPARAHRCRVTTSAQQRADLDGLVAARADADRRDRRAGHLLERAARSACAFVGQVVERRGHRRCPPSSRRSTRRPAWRGGSRSGSSASRRAARRRRRRPTQTGIRSQPGEHVELGEDEVGDAVDPGGVAGDRRRRTSRSGAAGRWWCRTRAPIVAQPLAVVVEQLGRERARSRRGSCRP